MNVNVTIRINRPLAHIFRFEAPSEVQSSAVAAVICFTFVWLF